MNCLRTHVQRFLLALAAEGPFFVCTYDDTDGLMLPAAIDPRDAEQVNPASALCNETGSLFSSDARMGRKRVRERTVWSFSLILRFDKEVVLEQFEQSLIDPVPHIPADDTFPQINLRLISSNVEHPTTNTPTTGTHVVYEIEAESARA